MMDTKEKSEKKGIKLIAKIFITGKIEAKTGLHIGGSKTSLDIGGVDLNVIKTLQGVPFIPGSSLKGKLRTMLARLVGSVAVSKSQLTNGLDKLNLKTDEDVDYIKEIFGVSGDDSANVSKDGKTKATRLLVRDAFLAECDFDIVFGKKEDRELDFDYSEIKWENTINRLTGTAQHPRQLERVPAGAKFNFELVYDVYEDVLKDKKEGDSNGYEEFTVIKEDNSEIEKVLDTDKHLEKIQKAIALLEDDYLGGSGSRGYGQVKFHFDTTKIRKIDQMTMVYGTLEDCKFQFK